MENGVAGKKFSFVSDFLEGKVCLGCDRDGVVRKHKHGSHPPEAREHTGQFLRTLLCFLPGDSPKQSPGSSALPKTCGRQPLPAFLFLVHSGVRFGFSSRSPLLTPDGPIRPVLSQRRVHKSVSPVSPSCSPPLALAQAPPPKPHPCRPSYPQATRGFTPRNGTSLSCQMWHQ